MFLSLPYLIFNWTKFYHSLSSHANFHLSYSSDRSLSRKTEFSSSSRNYSDDDLRSSEPRRHHRGSDRKHSEKHDYEQHVITNPREKQQRRSASIDHDSHIYWSDKDGVRQNYSSNLSPARGKRKLESRGVRSNAVNIHETDPDENMHGNDLDSYYHERPRSRRHREKQCRGAGSKRVENGRAKAKGEGPGKQKKMSTSPTINSDCSDREKQISGEESPRSDGSDKFEARKKRRRKNSSNWDYRDRGNGEDDYDNESIRGSSEYSAKYQRRKERQRAERGESERQFPVHKDKSERKRGSSSDDDRVRWEADLGDSA